MFEPLDPLPLPENVPAEFSAELEAHIREELQRRLGRAPTTDELQWYRQFLWAFAICVIACDEPPSTLSGQDER